MLSLRSRILVVFSSFGAVAAAVAQPDPSGIDFVTIGAPGNAPWTGFNYPLSPTFGRGRVDYIYRMSRTEISTEVWVRFFNAALARPDPLPFINTRWWVVPGSFNWGGLRDPGYAGPGVRYMVRTDIANAGMLPVSAVSWRMCAVMCNWLTNEMRTEQVAFLEGAYSVASFTPEIAFPQFNDQRRHTPGARYWISTLDEYMKAGFYDPDRHGPGQGGWWTQPNRSDTPLVYGPPTGEVRGQANAGFTLPGHAERNIPLGAYLSVQSPWGVLDLAGGTAEWLEDFRVSSDDRYYRLVDGSVRSTDALNVYDEVTRWGSDSPWVQDSSVGVRLAAAFENPCPGDLDDGSGWGRPDGGVTADDLLYFLTVFEQGVLAADLDDGSGMGIRDSGVTIEDLLFFLSHFFGGC